MSRAVKLAKKKIRNSQQAKTSPIKVPRKEVELDESLKKWIHSGAASWNLLAMNQKPGEGSLEMWWHACDNPISNVLFGTSKKNNEGEAGSAQTQLEREKLYKKAYRLMKKYVVVAGSGNIMAGTVLHEIDKEVNSLLAKIRSYEPTEDCPLIVFPYIVNREDYTIRNMEVICRLFYDYNEGVSKILHRNGLTLKMTYCTKYTYGPMYYIYRRDDDSEEDILSNEEHAKICKFFRSKIPPNIRAYFCYH